MLDFISASWWITIVFGWLALFMLAVMGSPIVSRRPSEADIMYHRGSTEPMIGCITLVSFVVFLAIAILSAIFQPLG